MYYKGLINRYKEYLPVSETTPIVTLNEGNTPLIKADNLAKKIGLDANIYLNTNFKCCSFLTFNSVWIYRIYKSNWIFFRNFSYEF